jgi:hypothetical protein
MAALMRLVGAVMVLVGLGLVALFFVGPPGGTAGNLPTGAAAGPTDGPADGTLYLTVPKIGLEDVTVHTSPTPGFLGNQERIPTSPGTAWATSGPAPSSSSTD